MNPLLSNTTKQKKSLNNLLIIKGFICDPGAIQTHDLQNRNLTLYSLSYGAILFMRGQKYKKSSHLPNDSSFFIVIKVPTPVNTLLF